MTSPYPSAWASAGDILVVRDGRPVRLSLTEARALHVETVVDVLDAHTRFDPIAQITSADRELMLRVAIGNAERWARCMDRRAA